MITLTVYTTFSIVKEIMKTVRNILIGVLLGIALIIIGASTTKPKDIYVGYGTPDVVARTILAKHKEGYTVHVLTSAGDCNGGNNQDYLVFVTLYKY
jgi:hypothetical protein